MIGVLFFMGFLWQGWFVWAALIVLLSRGSRAIGDITPWASARSLAIFLLCLFIVTVAPVPLRFVN